VRRERAITLSHFWLHGSPPGSRNRDRVVLAVRPRPVTRWRFHLFSILIGFGVATLCATGFLFLVHMFEDFGKE
jgi:hypothetical protein